MMNSIWKQKNATENYSMCVRRDPMPVIAVEARDRVARVDFLEGRSLVAFFYEILCESRVMLGQEGLACAAAAAGRGCAEGSSGASEWTALN